MKKSVTNEFKDSLSKSFTFPLKLKSYMRKENKRQKVGKYFPYLSFRFFCTAAKDYIHDYKYSGKVDELFESDYKLLIPEQCTGLKDKKKKWVFEGDILEFKTKDINPSLLNILKESKTLENWETKLSFQATVERDPCEPTNLTLELTTKSGLTAFLPISHVKKGEIVSQNLKPAKLNTSNSKPQ